MPALTADKQTELEATLKTTFKTFDDDGSGEIDSGELKGMLKSLGMIVNDETVNKLLKEADEDGNGTIEEAEFIAVMVKAANDPKGGGEFAKLVDRKKNNGPALGWADPAITKNEKHKVGPGITVAGNKITKEGGGWAVVCTDYFYNKGRTDDAYDAASCMFDIKSLPGPAFFGVVGPNYRACDFNEELSKSSHATSFAANTGDSKLDGECFRKTNKLQNICATTRVAAKPWNKGQLQMKLDMHEMSVVFTTLDDEGNVLQDATVGEIHNSVTFAVCLGPAPEGEKYEIELSGSSCEKTVVDNAMSGDTSATTNALSKQDDATAIATSLQQ